jgi:hypothetical protein
MSNFENFINISIIVSLLFTLLPIIEFCIDVIADVVVWLFKKILKISLTAYMLLVGIAWLYLIYMTLTDVLTISLNNGFDLRSVNTSNISHSVIERIFNQSIGLMIKNNR